MSQDATIFTFFIFHFSVVFDVDILMKSTNICVEIRVIVRFSCKYQARTPAIIFLFFIFTLDIYGIPKMV